MCLAGTLASPDLSNRTTGSPDFPSVREIPVDELGSPRDAMAATPRLARFIKLALGATQGLTEAEIRREPRVLELERSFEAVRRELAPDAASRLASIYLVENSPAGWNAIQRMKGSESFILEVEPVSYRRLSRHDMHWLDEYERLGADAAREYWAGEAASDEPRWEWLCEGVVRCADDEAVARLRQHVARTAPADFHSVMRAVGIEPAT